MNIKPYYVYRDGNGEPLVTIYHGDCNAVLDALALQVDAVVTDPPYQANINEEYTWDVWPGVTTWQAINHALKSDGLLAFTIAPRLAHARVPTLLEAGFDVLEVGAWIWGNGRPVHVSRPKRSWDSVYFMTKGRRQMYADGARGAYRSGAYDGRVAGSKVRSGESHRQFMNTPKHRTPYIYGAHDYHPANVACSIGFAGLGDYETLFAVKRLTGAGRSAAGAHPTEKPIDLLAQIIKLISQPGDLILDPFGGSGSLAEAAVLVGRRAIVIEQHEAYCQLAARALMLCSQLYYRRPFECVNVAKQN